MPSSVWVGGMRTSTIAASGLCARTFRSRSSASPACPTTSKPASSSRRTSPSRSSTESSATTSLIAANLAERDAGAHDGPAAVVVGDAEVAVESGDPVGEAVQPRAVGVGAAAPVVEDLDRQRAVALADAAPTPARPRRAWRRWRAPRRRGSRSAASTPAAGRCSTLGRQLDGDRRPRRERLQRRHQPAVGEQAGVDARARARAARPSPARAPPWPRRAARPPRRGRRPSSSAPASG